MAHDYDASIFLVPFRFIFHYGMVPYHNNFLAKGMQQRVVVL